MERNSMKFIIITGPQAVGKMTVGQELVKITNLKLLHNHMTIEIFKENNAQIYIVELEANLEERLKRNKMENRLSNKPSKRNLEWSEKDLLKSVEKYRFNSKENEIKEKNYLRIDNTNISAEIVDKMIKEKFKLQFIFMHKNKRRVIDAGHRKPEEWVSVLH